MKKAIVLFALAVAMLLSTVSAYADYKDSEAWNVAQSVVTEILEERGATKLRFAMIDYHVNRNDNRYAVYADVKYVDKAFKDQRDYFVVMFDDSGDGITLYMMTLGTEVILFDGFN